uniref:Carboxylesterase type B domain-containing protein n=1 Tax=Echeneis naucrates TaxID=173247 RepID=A0A665VMN8_ECHNA
KYNSLDHRIWSGLTFCYQHACHGAELPFLFDSAAVANFTMSPSEKLLSNRMLCYWGAFAHTGDPSSRAQQTMFCRAQRLPVWPQYSDTSGWLGMNLTVRSHKSLFMHEKETLMSAFIYFIFFTLEIKRSSLMERIILHLTAWFSWI